MPRSNHSVLRQEPGPRHQEFHDQRRDGEEGKRATDRTGPIAPRVVGLREPARDDAEKGRYHQVDGVEHGASQHHAGEPRRDAQPVGEGVDRPQMPERPAQLPKGAIDGDGIHGSMESFGDLEHRPGDGRVARPFGFALTDPGMRLSRTRLFPEVTRMKPSVASRGE